jgi:hypothetical protein
MARGAVGESLDVACDDGFQVSFSDAKPVLAQKKCRSVEAYPRRFITQVFPRPCYQYVQVPYYL